MRSVKQGRALAPEELETVDAMHRELLESLRLALAVFLQAEPRDAKRLAARKAQFREFDAAATALSVRLRAPRPPPTASQRRTEPSASPRRVICFCAPCGISGVSTRTSRASPTRSSIGCAAAAAAASQAAPPSSMPSMKPLRRLQWRHGDLLTQMRRIWANARGGRPSARG